MMPIIFLIRILGLLRKAVYLGSLKNAKSFYVLNEARLRLGLHESGDEKSGEVMFLNKQ
jgi:hypothetical protein